MIKLNTCTLRDMRESDAESIVKYANNAKIAANLRDGFAHPYKLEHAQGWIKHVLSQENTATIFAIDIDGEMVGAVGVHPLQDVYRYSAEVGYWLGEPFWGKGIVTKAVKAICKYAFDNTELVRLHAEVYEYNHASMRVLQKAGFYLETVRKRAVCKDNKIFNDHVYVLLRDED